MSRAPRAAVTLSGSSCAGSAGWGPTVPALTQQFAETHPEHAELPLPLVTPGATLTGEQRRVAVEELDAGAGGAPQRLGDGVVT